MQHNDEPIIIETSCGGTFVRRPSEMSDEQLRILIKRNPDNLDTPRMRAELAQRDGEDA